MRTGGYLAHGSVWKHGHAVAVKRADVAPRQRIHDLRHTAATLWLAASESVYLVQQQLGHRDVSTTIGLYGHPDRRRTLLRLRALGVVGRAKRHHGWYHSACFGRHDR